MPQLINDLSRAIRRLRNSPAIFAAATVSLAFGVGPNLTAFSLIREMVLDDVSADHPDRLARVEGLDVSYSAWRTLRSAGIFNDLAFYRGLGDQIWQEGMRSEIAWRVVTSSNFFDVLGIRASAGRLYSRADEGRELAVLSYGFWRKRLRAEVGVIGRPIRLNGRFYEVAGILPKDYRSVYGHGVSPEIYLSDSGNARAGDRVHTLFGRLRNDSSRRQTRLALTAAVGRIGGWQLAKTITGLVPMSGLAANAAKVSSERSFFLFFIALFGLASALTLIACCNVAGLLVAQAFARRRDLAILKALGANSFQLVKPLLAEGALLTTAGVSAGLALDAFARERLGYLRWPSAYALPIEFHFQSDGGLFLYASLVALAVLFFSSLPPAIGLSKADLGFAMKRSAPALSVRRRDLRSGFVLLQVALSMVLLTVGGVFTAGFLHLAGIWPGFDVEHTLMTVVHPLPGKSRPEIRRQILGNLEAIPGVIAATSTDILPLMGELPIASIRYPAEPLTAIRNIYVIGAGGRYFATLGIRLLRGREFTISDRTLTPIPVIVNRTLSREMFGDVNPVGRHLLMGAENEEPLEIVGVVADAGMRTLGEDNKPALFKPAFNSQLLVKVAGQPEQWVEPLRRALARIDDTTALDVRPLKDAAAGVLFPLRMAAVFFTVLSALGLALALLGLYGSVSDAVKRRELDFGIRVALGASRPHVLWAALRSCLSVLCWGVAIGIPLAVAIMRLLVDLFPQGVTPWTPALFALSALLLLGTGSVAGWLPARHAASSDPARLLRHE